MARSRIALAVVFLALALAVLVVPAGAQTPAPSPSASGSASASPSASPTAASASSSSPAEQTESLAVLLSAEPRTLGIDREGTVVAQVSNTGNTTIDAVLLDVTLPAEVEFVSSFPSSSGSSGRTRSFSLGPLDPGESAVAQITIRGTSAVTDAPVTARVAGDTATAEASALLSVVEGAEPDGLEVTSRSRQVLAQVGSMVHFEVTVSNEGDEDLDGVLVVDVAPREIDVFSVDLVDEVEAVQIGESGGRHDIVWNVGSLPAGSSVTLPWDGEAVRAGDLHAVNSVRGLLGTSEAARGRSDTFLAAEGPRDVEN
ncbi:MAG: DUF11 domain-containing protein, partial [Actinomycetota bacterium]|nr:DUF11 domain-containing protein [Actinomycetota bacterium]